MLNVVELDCGVLYRHAKTRFVPGQPTVNDCGTAPQ